jgi:acid phosphatase type 7
LDATPTPRRPSKALTRTPTLPLSTPIFTTPAAADPLAEAELIGAGDIAACNDRPAADSNAAITAGLLANFPNAAIFTAGDSSNEQATLTQYVECFGPTWGTYKARIHPAPGNHDYVQPFAEGYFQYFGAAAGDPAKGYYSFDLGAWHVLVINSNCIDAGGCEAGSPQYKWVQKDLATHPTLCSLAIWHAPTFSSGYHGNNPEMDAIWKALYNAGAELVISGHDHDYERFAPQNPLGELDPDYGMRQFVVGTGGSWQRTNLGRHISHSQKLIVGVHGVLDLKLHPGSYDWQFIPEPGKTKTDSGSTVCHTPPP